MTVVEVTGSPDVLCRVVLKVDAGVLNGVNQGFTQVNIDFDIAREIADAVDHELEHRDRAVHPTALHIV